MTMFTLPNFCRVCLKYDKNLIDLEHIENEPSETLMSKLQQCVSEVEWKVFKPLLCHPCIKRLNIAYTFKKQCVQSASMLKSYVALVKEKKNESQQIQNTKNDGGQSNAYMMLPNQKYIKIVVGPQNQNTFQNVFLNVVPTSSLNPLSPDNKSSKDTNQNVFLNINNTFQKYIPVAPAEQTQQKDKCLNVNQLLTESKSEELSVEIDPTDFGLGDGGSSDDDEAENGINDWEDVISSSQIVSRSNGSSCNGNQKAESTPKSGLYGNFVPILPKQSSDDKMEFFNSGQHFLTTQPYVPDFLCETCQKRFSTNKLLRHHIKDFHLGKFPFKCDYCYNEFILRAEYEACMKYHKIEAESLKNSITLNDFKNNTANTPTTDKGATTTVPETTQQELTDLVCELCHRQFNSTSGLLRHKVRKHNQKSKKKYFIKGMKNAKCDICNREFSTQSYMQLHRKLHLRDDIGYKYKVFGKNRYMKNAEQTRDSTENEEKTQKSDNQHDTSNNQEDMDVHVKEEEESKRKTDDEDDDSDNGTGSEEN